MRCTKCGGALEAGARFCGECGTPVTVATPVPVAAPPATAPDPVRQGVTPPPVMPPPPPPPASSRRGLFLGIGGTAIVASGLTYLVTRGPSASSPPTPTLAPTIPVPTRAPSLPTPTLVQMASVTPVPPTSTRVTATTVPTPVRVPAWGFAGGKAGGGDGASGSGAGEFWYPNGIAVDGTGAVWVADTENHRIQRFGVG